MGAARVVAAIFLAGCGLFPSLDELTGEGDASNDSNFNSDSTCSPCNVNDAGVDASDAKQTFDATPKDAKSDVAQGSIICGNGTVSDCANCPNAHQTCVTCDSSGTKSPPFCVATGDTCRNEPPTGYSTFTNGCDCSGGVATCPLANQVCHNGGFCHTCGEPLSSGETCKVGGTCDGSTCQ